MSGEQESKNEKHTQNGSAEKMTDKERVKEKRGKQALKGGWWQPCTTWVVTLEH